MDELGDGKGVVKGMNFRTIYWVSQWSPSLLADAFLLAASDSLVTSFSALFNVRISYGRMTTMRSKRTKGRNPKARGS